MSTLLNDEAALSRFADLAIQRLNARQIWLFGSRARGDHRADSDYDIMVILPDDSPAHAEDEIGLWKLTREAGLIADVFSIRESDYQASRDTTFTLAREVANSGRLIAG